MKFGQIARRFPLVARPRPACPPLPERIREIGDLAQAAAGPTGGLAQAAAAHNKAALIASDCGLPDLARSLCWRHHMVYLRAHPLGAQAARYALEPLVNLARLSIRDGDGTRGYQLLDTLFHTVRSRTHATIDGRRVSFEHLTETDEDHRALCQWLWTVLLADGTRALTSTGLWNDALTHLQRHQGVGRRMLDGRQIAVIASAMAGDVEGALALLGQTAPGESREDAVTVCLTVLCRRYADRPVEEQLAAMRDRYRRLHPTQGLAVFDTRLGLSAVDAAGAVEHPAVRPLADDLIHRTMASRDGYAARDLLAHNGCASLLTDRQSHDLADTVATCALGNRTIAPELQTALAAALDTSEAALIHTLTARPTNH